MASLKEIKGRIATVRSTLKITSAMKMISSVKMHRAQNSIVNLLPYQNTLVDILDGMLSNNENHTSPYFEKRVIKNVSIIIVSSNTNMCGAFNSNVIKMTQSVIDEYVSSGINDITIYTLGKVVSKHFSKTNYRVKVLPSIMVDKPTYESSYLFAQEIMTLFLKHETDRVDIVYNHYKSRASQIVTRDQYLPYEVSNVNKNEDLLDDFIFEPGIEEVEASLIEKVIKLKIFSVVSDSSAAEHAARMIAMQIATENADSIIEELTLQYNKSRQQTITNELLDIMGGFR